MSLPRSAILAAWTGAVLAGRASVGDAVASVTDDEEHDVARQDVDEALLASAGLVLPDPAFLSDLLVVLAALAERRTPTVRVLLPAAGDALGVPRAAGLLGWACEAGECVAVDGLGDVAGPWGLALVPEVSGFGSRWESGTAVSWQVWTTAAATSGAPADAHASVSEADLALRIVLRDVTRALERLDVAAWRGVDPATEEAVSAGARLPPLPPSLSTRSRGLLASAAQVLAIVEASATTSGGAVTGHEMDRRTTALSGAERAARRAIEAAVNLPG